MPHSLADPWWLSDALVTALLIEWYLILILTYISLMTSVVKELFMFSLAICLSSLVRDYSLPTFYLGCLLLNWRSSFYILNVLRYMRAHILSHLLRLSFFFFESVPWCSQGF